MRLYTPGGKGGFKVFSVTGQSCALNCAHCGRHYLAGMEPLRPGELPVMADSIVQDGYSGVLISGGADSRGSVPLLPFVEDIGKFKRKSGLMVNVHTGLVNDANLPGLLADANVDRVSFDLVGDPDVASRVYGIDIEDDAYLRSLRMLLQARLSVSPHITIGLDWGNIGHEEKAVDILASLPAEERRYIHSVVMLIIIPTPGTEMADVKPPMVEEVEEVFSSVRETLWDIPWVLGCMRPRRDRSYAHSVEMAALGQGCKGMVGATPETLSMIGSEVDRVRGCCVF